MAAKPCLLVVDDEPDLVQSVKDLLRFEFRVLGATRASEGLKIALNEPVEVVMSDQRMPEMTGVEFLTRLKEAQPDTVRLLFTAYADLDAVIDAINEGNVYRYIAKPWEPGELKAMLRQAHEYHELQAERRQLLREVQEKNAQLEAANRELRQADALKHAFIKVAAHELRTPLTIALGMSDLAARADGVSPAVQGWLRQIQQAGRRLNDRVDLMVKLLQTQRFERPLQPQAVDLGELLRQAGADVASFVQTRGQQLQLDVPDDVGTVQVEPDKLQDAVVQLLINAIKFTPDGGTIRLAASRSPDGAATIIVADTGMGMDAEQVRHVFEPFFTRADVRRHCSGTFEYDRRGLGLGLSVAKAFVEMHGGTIRAESEPGRGTRFTIELPE
jgi:signal transduction histidine kinase